MRLEGSTPVNTNYASHPSVSRWWCTSPYLGSPPDSKLLQNWGFPFYISQSIAVTLEFWNAAPFRSSGFEFSRNFWLAIHPHALYISLFLRISICILSVSYILSPREYLTISSRYLGNVYWVSYRRYFKEYLPQPCLLLLTLYSICSLKGFSSAFLT